MGDIAPPFPDILKTSLPKIIEKIKVGIWNSLEFSLIDWDVTDIFF